LNSEKKFQSQGISYFKMNLFFLQIINENIQKSNAIFF